MNEFLESELMRIDENQERKQRVLSQLLEEIRTQRGHHFVLQVHMGEVTSYLSSVTLEWVTDKVGFADDLPIFQKRDGDDGSRQIQWDSGTMELIQQRKPDWQRQLAMSAYLAIRQHHKFPPLLLVGYQPWIYEDHDEQWGTDKRAMNDSLTLIGLEPTGTYWNLDDAKTQFYALDGQHRLMAFRGLRELIRVGQLPALDKNGRAKRGGELTRQEIIDYIHKETGESAAAIHERLQRLMSEERIGIEIIPAVRQGESYTEALRRLRQMFVDVNENARSLTKAQIAQLDEANGFRIIARKLCMEHELFKSGISADGESQLRVYSERDQLPENSDCYTTLYTLEQIVKRHLKENSSLPRNENYTSWDNLIAKGVSVRPADSILDQGTEAMLEYFGHLKKIPSHTAYIQGKPGGEIRKSKDGEDNILFRPMVQTALAEALGKLAARGVPLDAAVAKLVRGEERGELKLTERAGPWFGVACDINGKMRRNKQFEDLSSRMFQYLLGGGIQDDFERDELRADFAKARQPDPTSGKAINLDGKPVDADDVRLPDPWQ